MNGKDINELKIGDEASFSKTISESDVYLYAGVTGDLNPAHVNEEYAKSTFFKKRIAHGMLTAGLISAVISNRLPGPGAIYVNQTLHFLHPVFIGDTITARVEVVGTDKDKNRLQLKTECINQEGECVLEGEAIISPPKRSP